MPSPTMARGLLGHFSCGADPSAINQHASPRPSDRQHLRPYGKYRRPGTEQEACGAERADTGSRGTMGVRVAE